LCVSCTGLSRILRHCSLTRRLQETQWFQVVGEVHYCWKRTFGIFSLHVLHSLGNRFRGRRDNCARTLSDGHASDACGNFSGSELGHYVDSTIPRPRHRGSGKDMQRHLRRYPSSQTSERATDLSKLAYHFAACVMRSHARSRAVEALDCEKIFSGRVRSRNG